MASRAALVAVGSQISLSVVAAGASRRAGDLSQTSLSQCSALRPRTQQLRSLGLVGAPESRMGFAAVVKASKTQVETPVQTEVNTDVDPSEAAADLLKSAQEAWDKVDDKLAVGGLGFAGLILLWASIGLLSAIDKLPLVPGFLEFVGLFFSGWFTYRYLLFKPDREELLKLIEEARSKITGQ